ncbi:hypothetical protein ACOSQ3_018069 [Xanthoceras sorbifolium]
MKDLEEKQSLLTNIQRHTHSLTLFLLFLPSLNNSLFFHWHLHYCTSFSTLMLFYDELCLLKEKAFCFLVKWTCIFTLLQEIQRHWRAGKGNPLVILISIGLFQIEILLRKIGIMDHKCTDLTRKRLHSKASAGILNGEISWDLSKRVTSPNCLLTSTSFYLDEESGSKTSSSCMESNSQDSTFIALKLGRFIDYRDIQNGEFFRERSNVSSVHPSLTTKRTRRTSSCSQTPLCQVYGCNKDLSSSKDYHKRHKVCELHTKTPKVVVNGNEQRFCQQCSRFHLLAEFDDSKRSCRRRLSGHNERRRKPQFNILSGKPHKLLHSYQGTKFFGTSLPKGASFVFPDLLPAGMLFPEIHEQAYQFEADEIFQESDLLNAKYSFSPERGSTVDLLQLSSHLERVERQRNSLQFKQQYDDRCFLIT